MDLEDIEQLYDLKSDVMQLTNFDKLWEFWVPFTDMLDEKSVRDLS
jgi:hypothetical protein